MATSIRSSSNETTSRGLAARGAAGGAPPSPIEIGRGGDSLDPLIGKLYEAALRPEGWAAFLEDFARAMRADAMTLIAAAANGGSLRELCFDTGTDPKAERDYRDYFSGIDPWVEAGVLELPVGAVSTSQAVLPDSELVRTEFYNDYYKPNGWHHGFGAKLFEDSEGIVATVTGHRRKNAGAFETEEMELLQRIVPHLRRALRMRQEFEQLVSEREAEAQLLERVSLGTVLVDAHGTVVRTNHLADAILSANDGLRVGRQGLEAACSRETGLLRQAIASAADTSLGTGTGAGGRFRISRPSGEMPYLVEVSPVDPGASVWGTSRTLAAILVTDGRGGAGPDCEALRAFYGLTPAEAELASMLARGMCLDEAACSRGVSRNTARGQLKRIFAKTGTNRQAELVRLVLQGPAGFTAR